MKPRPVVFKKTASAGPSPTQRTLAYLKKQGYHCGIVERRNPAFRNVSNDLFGIIDIIALHSNGVTGVQSAGAAFSAHRQKLTVYRARETVVWLRTPGTFLMLIGWRKLKNEQGISVWRPRIEMITLDAVKTALVDANRFRDIASLKL